MARRLPNRDRPYPAPGTLTTNQVQARLGVSYRQLNYARTQTRLAEMLGPKRQRFEWPEDVVRRMEVALAIANAIPQAARTHSNLPGIVEIALDIPEVPETGWALYTGQSIVISHHLSDLPLDWGGVVVPVPLPWSMGEEEARAPRRRGWAIVEER